MPTLNSPTIRELASFIPSGGEANQPRTQNSEWRMNNTAISWLQEVVARMIAFQVQLEIPLNQLSPTRDFLNALMQIDATILSEARVDEPLRFLRYAPSIITRGEIEVMGLSIPRFSVRCYLSENYEKTVASDFMNMRRLHEECRYVRKEWEPVVVGLPKSNFIALEKLAKKLQVEVSSGPSPREMLTKSSPIADCFLKFANRNDEFILLEVPLGIHYGECQTKELDFNGTPYVQGTSLSGMCAQAVCFMANSILIEHARGLFGIAEISVIASGDTNEHVDRHALLQGLTEIEVERYFQSHLVGLSAKIQAFSPRLSRASTSYGGVLVHRWFNEALTSYIRSGIPVILQCDLAKLNPIYANHTVVKYELMQTPLKKFEIDEGEVVPHFVCIVGVKAQPIDSNLFVVNDPAFLPFLEIDSELLRNAILETPDDPVYIPVVPARVKMPLNSVYDEGITSGPPYRYCLLEVVLRIAEDARRKAKNGIVLEPAWQQLPGFENINSDRPNFRLVRITKDTNALSALMSREMVRLSIAEKVLDWVTVTLGRSIHTGGELWVWLQFSGDYLWIWNAEVELNSKDSADALLDNCLLFACNLKEVWSVRPAQMLNTTEDKVENTYGMKVIHKGCKDLSSLKVGLINSYGALDCRKAFAKFPQELVESAEVYCFLRREWLEIFVGDGLQRVRHAFGVRGCVRDIVEQGGSGGKPLEEIVQNCADWLHKVVSEKGIKIGSLASFIPEISSHLKEEREDASSALRFLIEVAAALRGMGHEMLSHIEMVGGSRIQGVSYGWNSEGRIPAQAMNLPKSQSVEDRLVEALEPLVKLAVDKDVWLALEMEPGPLHLLNSLEVIERILGKASLSQGIGLNLDLAHFRILAGIEPAKLRPEIRQRILGVHISGHSKGHLGDLHLNALNQLEDGLFDTWLNELADLASKRQRFKGVINIEMEACRCEMEVASSCRMLRDYIDKNSPKILPQGAGRIK
jgi:sugar phosphate isomerase/epimerase